MNKKLFQKLFLVFIPIFLSFNFVFAQSDTYQNVSSGLDNSSTTVISNTSTGGLADTARYLALMVSAAIITVLIFKFLEGAVLKGTLDNFYDQQKGNKVLQNAMYLLLIFIFVNLLFTYINPDYGSWIFNTSTGVTPGSTVSGGVCVVDQAYNNKSVEDEIKQDEEDGKYKPWVYMDSTGHPTIGWGFNLAQSGASGFMQKAGVDNNTISSLLSTSCKNVSVKDSSASADKNCATTITQSQADAIFNTELATQKDNINKWVGGADKYNALPTNIQKALLNIMYNVGSDSMSKFTKMKVAVDSKDWKGVASELQNSTYCSQVGQRCSRLVGLILGECPTLNSANNPSLYSNNQDRCNAIKNIKQSDLTDLKALGIPCTSSYGCLLRTDVANNLKSLEDAYKNSSGKYFTVTSAYRSDTQQSNTCDTVSAGGKCAAPCSKGGTGSEHSVGDAIDVAYENNIVCKNGNSSGCGKSNLYNWLKQNATTFHFQQNQTIQTSDPIHWSTGGN